MCTLGPATSTQESITALVEAGMDVARLNLSHGTHAEHEAVYRMVRKASDETGHGVGIFADLQGPKIRLGWFAEGGARLQTGQSFTITTRDISGTNEIAPTTYDGLPGDVRDGDQILIDDGKVRLRLLDLRDHREQDSLLAHDLPHVLDVLGRPHERQCDEVDGQVQRPAKVLDVLLRHRGHAHRDLSLIHI